MSWKLTKSMFSWSPYLRPPSLVTPSKRGSPLYCAYEAVMASVAMTDFLFHRAQGDAPGSSDTDFWPIFFDFHD